MKIFLSILFFLISSSLKMTGIEPDIKSIVVQNTDSVIMEANQCMPTMITSELLASVAVERGRNSVGSVNIFQFQQLFGMPFCVGECHVVMNNVCCQVVPGPPTVE